MYRCRSCLCSGCPTPQKCPQELRPGDGHGARISIYDEVKTAVLFKTSRESPVTGSRRGGYQSDSVKISKMNDKHLHSLHSQSPGDLQSPQHISSLQSPLKSFSLHRSISEVRLDLQYLSPTESSSPLTTVHDATSLPSFRHDVGAI